MAKSFDLLRKKMTPRSRRVAEAKTQRILKEIKLQELREGYEISQETLAERLATKQANISRFERRKDMYISSLRKYIEAMGGKLSIVARFPEGDVHININQSKQPRAPAKR